MPILPEIADLKTVIKVENIGKEYRLGEIAKDSIKDSVRNLFSTSKAEKESFWALKDVSFDVNEGDVLGIVGKNGAGKSTLLKVLSRITYPTEGKIEMEGRVASLLEVGTGFHPELTGRENIFLNGSILGMSRKEIKAKFDEIVEFSGVARFIDTPVKHYSSGMYVRLAFSVAAHLEPEILIIDEVLAVGDADFQKKCLGKMKAVAGEGRTVLFVSHNMAAVKSLCSKAILLESGRITCQGDVNEVVSKYLGANDKSNNERSFDKEYVYSEFILNAIKVYANESDFITRDDQIVFEIIIEKLDIENELDITLQIANMEGEVIIVTGSGLTDLDSKSIQGELVYKATIPSDFLNEGQFSVNALIVKNHKQVILNASSILNFTVLPSNTVLGKWMGKSKGYVKSKFKWQIVEH